jgi:hypothetical protein
VQRELERLETEERQLKKNLSDIAKRPAPVERVSDDFTVPQIFTAGIKSAGWLSSAIANRSIVSILTERRPRSINEICVRWSSAASASDSCDMPRASRNRRTRCPNLSL